MKKNRSIMAEISFHTVVKKSFHHGGNDFPHDERFKILFSP